MLEHESHIGLVWDMKLLFKVESSVVKYRPWRNSSKPPWLIFFHIQPSTINTCQIWPVFDFPPFTTLVERGSLVSPINILPLRSEFSSTSSGFRAQFVHSLDIDGSLYAGPWSLHWRLGVRCRIPIRIHIKVDFPLQALFLLHQQPWKYIHVWSSLQDTPLKATEGKLSVQN